MEAFCELRGQAAAVERLQGALSRDRVHHAWLFEGPGGVGKRSAARIFAKTLLCGGRGSAPDPCGRCPACGKFDAGTHADLIWTVPEGRSVKVGEVRAGERRLRLRPLEGSRKVWVLDPAHTLTPEAQNALLKTLEEPPGEATLILLTSRPSVLLPTVRSRCQRLPFGPLTADTVQSILEAQGTPRDLARTVANLSDGSLGLARSADPEELVQARDEAAALDRRLDPVRSVSAAECLEVAQDLAAERVELARTLDHLLAWTRDQTLVAAGASSPLANADRRADLQALAAARSLDQMLRRAEAVLEARRQLELPFNLNPTLVAEQLCLSLGGWGRMIPVAV